MNIAKKALLLTLVIATISGCFGKKEEEAVVSASGPIDGTYAMTGMNCNGVSQGSFLDPGATGMFLIIQNSTGAMNTPFASGCTKTEPHAFTYPAANQIAMVKLGVTCQGSCSGSECTASSTTSTDSLSYAVSGNTVTFSKVQGSGGGGCSVGQTVEYIMTKL